MSTSFVIRLDTTAPVVAFTHVSFEVTLGDELRVPFTLDEPDAISATLVRGNGDREAMTLEVIGPLSRAAVIDIPAPSSTRLRVRRFLRRVGLPPEQAHVEVVVRDEVLNEALYTVPVTIVEEVVVPPTPVPELPGGIREPVLRRHEDRFEGEFLATVTTVDRFVGSYSVRVTERVEAEFAVVRALEDRAAGELMLSTRMSTLRREDDEILLLI
jgi:hypothetical protein